MQWLWFGVQKILHFFYLQSDSEREREREIHSYIPYRFCLSKRKQFYSACLPPFSWLVGWTALSFLLLHSFCSPITTNEGLPLATLRFLHFSLLFGNVTSLLLSTFIGERLKILFYLHIICTLSRNTRERTWSSTLHHHQYTISLLPPRHYYHHQWENAKMWNNLQVFCELCFKITQNFVSSYFFVFSNLLQRFVRNFTIFSP